MFFVDIFDISIFGFDVFFIISIQWYVLDWFIRCIVCSEELFGDGVVIGENVCMVIVQGDQYGIGQCCQINDQFWFEVILCVLEYVIENEMFFGIGVEDFDCLVRY